MQIEQKKKNILYKKYNLKFKEKPTREFKKNVAKNHNDNLT